MKTLRLALFLLAFAGIVGLTAGCSTVATRGESSAGKNLESFPYHPLVYHLDLSILAYQLYSQTLVWPFDPYYEEMTGTSDGRDRFINKVRAWAKKKGAEQLSSTAGLDAYRGPGILSGFENNPLHDPIIYNYARLHPWSNTITMPLANWTIYMTPREITGQVKEVYMCYRTAGGAEGDLSLDQVELRRDDRAANANDILLAFEGGTGDKGEAGQPAAQSIMGFVLLRTKADGGYDVHVAFRGSRSGSGARALRQSLSDEEAAGNPDWITDMGYNRVAEGTSAVSRGFARSMISIFPQAMHCLNTVATIRKGVPPDNIYITGHSLGAGLAQHFVGAVLLGDRYGPGGRGDAMPMALRDWPWKQIKLITYGAPRAGDEEWAKTLTESGLESEFFSSAIDPLDRNALAVTDSSILSRLFDPLRPVGYRVLITRDPITTEKVFGGGKHVGKTVYVNEPSVRDLIPVPDLEAHEPWKIRKFMLDDLADPRTPGMAWANREITDLVPDRNAENRGSAAELLKLADAIKRYYSDNNIWYDEASFDKDVELRLAIDRGE